MLVGLLVQGCVLKVGNFRIHLVPRVHAAGIASDKFVDSNRRESKLDDLT